MKKLRDEEWMLLQPAVLKLVDSWSEKDELNFYNALVSLNALLSDFSVNAHCRTTKCEEC